MSIIPIRGAFCEVPPLLRKVLTVDPEERTTSLDVEYPTATLQATAAIAYARQGFRLLPCLPGSKDPHIVGEFKHAAHSATSDYERLVEHWLDHPDDNVGFAPDGRIVVVDVDPRHGGTLEVVEALGLPVDGYRYQSVSGGWHIPLTMPDGTCARTSFQPASGIEIRGPGSYVVTTWSQVEGRWYRIEPDRNIWRYGQIPDSWPLLEKLTSSVAAVEVEFTATDLADARVILNRMRKSSDFGAGLAALLDNHPDWPKYFPSESPGGQDTSRSGRDYRIALAASHFLRDHPRRVHVLATLVYQLSQKAHERHEPTSYLASVVHAALEERARRDTENVEVFLEQFVEPLMGTVFDGNFPISKLRKLDRTNLLEQTICRFSSVDASDCYTRNDGWRRFPVGIAAEAFGVSRRAVCNRLRALCERGVIERKVSTYRHDGGVRRDSLVRASSSLGQGCFRPWERPRAQVDALCNEYGVVADAA